MDNDGGEDGGDGGKNSLIMPNAGRTAGPINAVLLKSLVVLFIKEWRQFGTALGILIYI